MRNQLWPLWFQTCFVAMASFIVRPASAYRALELGIDPIWLGIIAAAYAIIPLFVAPIIGHFADAGYERIALILGAGAMLAGALGLLAYSSSLLHLLLWNALIGIGHILTGVGSQTLVAHDDVRSADVNFGMYTFAGSVGQTLGPLTLTVLAGQATLPNTTYLFAAAVGLTCLAVVCGFAVARGGRSAARARNGTDLPSFRQALTAAPRKVRAQLLGAITVSMVILAAIDLLSVYLPAWGVESGMSAFTVGILLTVRSVGTMLSRLGLGALVRAFSRSTLIVASTIIAALSLLILVFPIDVVAAGIVLFVAGAALGIGQPLTMAAVSAAAPAGTVGLWLSIRLTGNSLGLVVIPPVVGIVGGVAGAAGVFGTLAASLLMVAGASWVGRRFR